MTTIKVDITKRIIKETANCENKSIEFNCAVAKAINDLLPCSWIGKTEITVFRNMQEYRSQSGGYGVDYRSPSEMRSLGKISLPAKAIRFVSRFDKRSPWRRRMMSPFSFEIEIPDSIIDFISEGNMEVVREIINRSDTMSLVPKQNLVREYAFSDLLT